MPSFSSLAAAALLAAAAHAHFTLDTPPSIGFDDDKESDGPCGGFVPDFSGNVSDFAVGGDRIATTQLHAQGTWLYRAVASTTLPADDSADWVQLFPLVQQTGIGKLCEPAVPAPAAWAGQQGILSVVVDAPDGLLYQCAAVRFVAGTASGDNSACANASSIDVSFVADAKLTPLAGSGSGSDSTNSSSTASTTASSTAATTASSTATAATSSSTSSSAASRTAALSVGGLAVLAAALLL